MAAVSSRHPVAVAPKVEDIERRIVGGKSGGGQKIQGGEERK